MSDQKQTGALHLSDDDFQKALDDANQPMLVDFFAEWCGPCKMAAPVIDKLADEYRDKMIIAKVDVDANGQTAMKYGVMSIPTVLILKKQEDGEMKVIDQQIGFPGEEGYRKMIEKALAE